MVNNVANAVSSYDGYWLASYQAQEPTREKCYGNIQIVSIHQNLIKM